MPSTSVKVICPEVLLSSSIFIVSTDAVGASFVPVRLMTISVVSVAPLSSVTTTAIVIVNASPSVRDWYASSLGSKL